MPLNQDTAIVSYDMKVGQDFKLNQYFYDLCQ